MSYYMQGDFYGRGGYYRGDPGFFSFLGGVAKSAVGLIPGVGPMLSAGLSSLAKKPGSAIVKGAEASPAAAGMAHAAGKMLGTAVRQHPVLTAAGAAGGLLGAGAAAGALARGRMGKGAMAMPGMRRRRRMNACNPRALRRAIRRAHAFERLAKKVIGFSSPRKPRGHMYFKRKRKR